MVLGNFFKFVLTLFNFNGYCNFIFSVFLPKSCLFVIILFFRNNRNRFKYVDSRQAHVCPYCLDVLKTRYSLQKHISVKHFRHKPFSCTECNKTFSNNCDLKRHRSNSHAQQKMVKCEICLKEYRSGYLARHRQFAHSKHNAPSTCDKCYKVFKTREIMLQHSRLKHNVSQT